MKRFESKQADIWTMVLCYPIVGLISIFVLFNLLIPAISEFEGIEDNWILGYCLIFAIPLYIRMSRKRYIVNDNFLWIKDFLGEYINLDQDVSEIIVLPKKKWLTLNDPHTIIIRIKSGRKIYVSTQNDKELIDIFKEHNVPVYMSA